MDSFVGPLMYDYIQVKVRSLSVRPGNGIIFAYKIDNKSWDPWGASPAVILPVNGLLYSQIFLHGLDIHQTDSSWIK